jgi:hypothetical protein
VVALTTERTGLTQPQGFCFLVVLVVLVIFVEMGEQFLRQHHKQAFCLYFKQEQGVLEERLVQVVLDLME